MLKEERQRRILDLLAARGRVVATALQDELDVSGDTVRRDLDELAGRGSLQRVHGGALPRSSVPRTYEARQDQAVAGKVATARAAATLLREDEVVLLDGGSTALQLVGAIPPGHRGTFVTHSPPVAEALGRHGTLEVHVVGGTLDPRAMVAVGAQTVRELARVTADVLFLGVWAVHAEHGLSTGYAEEAEVREVLLQRAGRVVGLATREKLGTVAPFRFGPASALTHLATEPGVPDAVLAPFADLGVEVVRGA